MLISHHRYSVEQLTTTEMTPKEFEEFKSGWIRAAAYDLQGDGITDAIATASAKSEFEVMAKGNFQRRDAFVLKLRKDRQEKRSVLTKRCQ